MKMGTIKGRLCIATILSAFALNAAASPVEIIQSSLFLSIPSSPATPVPGVFPDPGTGTSYQDDQLGDYNFGYVPHNTFDSGGFGVSYSDTVVGGLGTLIWSITNNSGVDIANSQFTGFLDVDLGPVFFENFGETQGAIDTQYDSWEIDDRDPFFGDIYAHVQSATDSLDNTNSLPTGSWGDVSLALGFNISDLLIGETIIATFLISDALTGPAGLAQFDVNSNDVIYFSGSIDRVSVVPLPGSGGLMLSSLILMAVGRYRKKYGKVN
jgi:hypothetical protein